MDAGGGKRDTRVREHGGMTPEARKTLIKALTAISHRFPPVFMASDRTAIRQAVDELEQLGKLEVVVREHARAHDAGGQLEKALG